MQWVRRHRHRILLVFGLGAVGAMGWGYLKRVGVDPLAPLTPESPEVMPSANADCEPVDYEGFCELRGVTPLSGSSPATRRLRAVYRLRDGPRGAEAIRNVEVPTGQVSEATRELEAESPVACQGVWMAGACESPPFVFGSSPGSDL